MARGAARARARARCSSLLFSRSVAPARRRGGRSAGAPARSIAGSRRERGCAAPSAIPDKIAPACPPRARGGVPASAASGHRQGSGRLRPRPPAEQGWRPYKAAAAERGRRAYCAVAVVRSCGHARATHGRRARALGRHHRVCPAGRASAGAVRRAAWCPESREKQRGTQAAPGVRPWGARGGGCCWVLGARAAAALGWVLVICRMTSLLARGAPPRPRCSGRAARAPGSSRPLPARPRRPGPRGWPPRARTRRSPALRACSRRPAPRAAAPCRRSL